MANAGDGGLLPQLRRDDLLSELQARLEAVLGTRDRMHGLLEAVVAIGSGLELEAMLRRIVEAAVDLVDARYGALGVIGEDQRLIEFIPVGLGTEEISEIHHWPEGRGLNRCSRCCARRCPTRRAIRGRPGWTCWWTPTPPRS
jgi:hypothetical protein